VIRVALVSFAHMHAWSYARALREMEREGRVIMAGVYDDDGERLSKVVEALKPRKVYRSLEEIVNDPVDAAVVTSENAKHASMALPLLRSGKHVLVEKPITTTLRDGNAMVEEARRAGVKLQVAFTMRYHDAVLEVKNRLKEVGELRAITCTNHGRCPFSWFVEPSLSGGGAIMDHVVHVADLTRWFTGEEFSEVNCFVGKGIYDLKVEDNALLLAKLQDGTPVSIDCSWSRPRNWPQWGDVFMRIVGSKGVITLNAFNQNIWLADEKGFRFSSFGPDSDRNMIEDFVRVVEEGGEPRARGEDGVQALRLVLAAYRSWREGRVVKTDELS